MENICSLEEAQKISNKIVQWRRDLHKIPEIGMELPKTEAYLKKILEQLDIKYKSYSGHSGLTVDFGRKRKNRGHTGRYGCSADCRRNRFAICLR